ncbi:MAG: PAS domain-containing protein [Acidobacteria bacterium]|nr:PAS domain-containing protein [Acidobacteriota bacterium]
MCREFHRVMDREGPSHTTLLRYAIGNVKRRNVVTEQYVREAIHKVTVELVQKELSESETQRNRAEKELHQTEIRFRQLVENARDLIYRYRFAPPRGLEYISPAIKDLLGYDPEEFQADSKLVLKIVHPDDLERLAQSMEGKGPFHERATFRWVHRDGRVIWIERVNVPVYDEAGNLVAMEGIARQPNASGDIRGAMIVAAGLIEGVTFFALIVTILLAIK